MFHDNALRTSAWKKKKSCGAAPMCVACWGISVPRNTGFHNCQSFLQPCDFYFLNRNLIITSKILANHTTVKKRNSQFFISPPFPTQSSKDGDNFLIYNPLMLYQALFLHSHSTFLWPNDYNQPYKG